MAELTLLYNPTETLHQPYCEIKNHYCLIMTGRQNMPNYQEDYLEYGSIFTFLREELYLIVLASVKVK